MSLLKKKPVTKVEPVEETAQGEAPATGKKKSKKKSSDNGSVKHLYQKVLDWLHDNYDWRFNVIKQYTEFKIKDEDKWIIYDGDRHLNSIFIKMTFEDIFPKSVTSGLLKTLIESEFTLTHNAIADYFKTLKPVKKDYIKELTDCLEISDINLTPNLTLKQAFYPLFRRWLVASVKGMLAEVPNSLNGVMLVLIGPQGKYKSTFLRALCPPVLKSDYYFEGHLDLNSGKNDVLNLLAEMVIVNIDDQLSSLFGKDYNTIKSFITLDSVTNRKAYARNTKSRRRIAVLVGSVNGDTLFRDTENRRYLTAKINGINYEKLSKIDINNVWAQAYEIYKEGKELTYFGSADVETINLINNKFLQPSPEEEWLIKLYDPAINEEPGTEFEMTTEILANVRNASGLQVYQDRIIDALKRAGFIRVSKRMGDTGSPRYCYMVKKKFFIADNGKVKFTA